MVALLLTALLLLLVAAALGLLVAALLAVRQAAATSGVPACGAALTGCAGTRTRHHKLHTAAEAAVARRLLKLLLVKLLLMELLLMALLLMLLLEAAIDDGQSATGGCSTSRRRCNVW